MWRREPTGPLRSL